MNRRDFLKSCKPNKKTRAGLFGGVPVVDWTLTQEYLDADLKRLDSNYEPKYLQTTGYVDIYEDTYLPVGEKQEFNLFRGAKMYSGTGMVVARKTLTTHFMSAADPHTLVKSNYEFIVKGLLRCEHFGIISNG